MNRTVAHNMPTVISASEANYCRRQILCLGGDTMKNQLVSFIYSLLSNPQRVRLIVIVIAICLLLAALSIPTLATLANGMSGGGGH